MGRYLANVSFEKLMFQVFQTLSIPRVTKTELILTISSRQVMRIKKNIHHGTIS